MVSANITQKQNLLLWVYFKKDWRNIRFLKN